MTDRPHAISFPEKGRTKQSHKSECDINNIMKRFEKSGMLEHLNTYNGVYGDFTQVPADYQAAVELVRSANEMFMTIPAKVRQSFDNDPGKFLAFVENPENIEEMRNLGLAHTPPPGEPSPAAPEAPGAAETPPPGGNPPE